jgi:hypothetical protein
MEGELAARRAVDLETTISSDFEDHLMAAGTRR